MNRFQWPMAVAKTFAVLATSTGAGFIAGALTFTSVGQGGNIYGGPFGHVADIVGWGTGFLCAGLMTFGMILFRKHEPAGKPEMYGRRDEV